MTEIIEVKFKCTRVGAIKPCYQTAGAAGMDMHACLNKPVVIPAGQTVTIPTGIALEIPEGWQVEARGRSGLAVRHAIGVVHGVGTIDSDYRGEMFFPLHNHHPTLECVIEHGDRIGQIVLMPAPRMELVEVFGELSETARGAAGAGSTGMKAFGCLDPSHDVNKALEGSQ